MITYSENTDHSIKASHLIAPNYTVESVENLIEEGSSSTETHHDAVVNVTDFSVVDFNAQIFTDAFTDTIYTSMNEVATVDDFGKVERIINGKAIIEAQVGPNRQKLEIQVYRQDPIDLTVFTEWVSGSIAHFVDARIRTLTQSISPSDQTRLIFQGNTRNSQLFCAAYQESMTGMARYCDGSSHIGYTAITKRHVVSCYHSNTALSTGQTLTFVTQAGQEINRTITHAYRVGSTDILMYLLNQDLPTSIKPLKIFPSNLSNYIKNPQYRFPLLYSDRNNLMNIMSSKNIDSNSLLFNAASEEFYGFFTIPQTGTSGKPILIPVSNSELAIFCTFTTPFSGPAYHARNWSTLIASLDVLAGISTGYTPTTANLSAFTSF